MGCAEDYVAALRLRGLERHKKLAELSEYGCVTTLPWLYSVHVKETHPITVEEETVAVLHLVNAIINSEVIGTMPGMTSENILVQGWILDEHLIRMTEDELRHELKHRVAGA